MGTKGEQFIVTYYGLDGACAAAAALVRYQEAKVVTTSARRIGETLQEISLTDAGEVNVCGVGVACDWSAVEPDCPPTPNQGGPIYSHCGRE